ncbi:uncharacterized protein LOC115748028 [Rhodamnia argentea]|uniref:Uncharacterized protein LOC115748028 n=1 Tax=Rhodamnia argentea TaxID=178133 RepID=A0A8B8Q149_9MYRT|nr:uncharacterized protein LOC115748028 [Rhodamnia argentea]XP_048132036.1 uncharacterized protein LOC115748028 [Rhodamnia argentea]
MKGQKNWVREKHTHPLIWCAAIICAILSVAVIIAGIAVFVGYVIVHPRVPFISVVGGNLDVFQVDPAGVLVSQVTIDIKAENDNARAHASFQNLDLVLSFGGQDVAELRADPFDVRKNTSTIFHYVVQSSPIPLDPGQTDAVSESLRRNEVTFNLKGSARARWRVGFLGSLKYWCHLDCHLQFHPLNQTLTNAKRCSSRGK